MQDKNCHVLLCPQKPGSSSSSKKMASQKGKTGLTLYKNAVNKVQELFLGLLLLPASYKAVFYWFLVILGSFICDFLPIPQSYFSNRRNVLNVYFVKWSWGWTLCLLSPHIFLTSAVYTYGNIVTMIRNLTRLAVGTAFWYFWVNLFLYIKQETGSCVGDKTTTAILACRKKGFHWYEFDISGHTFLLIYCCLIIAEELQIMRDWDSVIFHMEPRNDKQKLKYWHSVVTPLAKALLWSTGLLQILWEFMFLWTCLYFHTVSQKVLGAVVAIFTWLVTYKMWYKFRISPGLPWKPRHTESKQPWKSFTAYIQGFQCIIAKEVR